MNLKGKVLVVQPLEEKTSKRGNLYKIYSIKVQVGKFVKKEYNYGTCQNEDIVVPDMLVHSWTHEEAEKMNGTFKVGDVVDVLLNIYVNGNGFNTIDIKNVKKVDEAGNVPSDDKKEEKANEVADLPF